MTTRRTKSIALIAPAVLLGAGLSLATATSSSSTVTEIDCKADSVDLILKKQGQQQYFVCDQPDPTKDVVQEFSKNASSWVVDTTAANYLLDVSAGPSGVSPYFWTGDRNGASGAAVGASGNERQVISGSEQLVFERANLKQFFSALRLGVDVVSAGEGAGVKVTAYNSQSVSATNPTGMLATETETVKLELNTPYLEFFELEENFYADKFVIEAANGAEFALTGALPNELLLAQPTKSGDIEEGDTVVLDTSGLGIPVTSTVEFLETELCNVNNDDLATFIEYTLTHSDVIPAELAGDGYKYSAEWVVPNKSDLLQVADEGTPEAVGSCLFLWTTEMTGVGASLTPLIDFDGEGSDPATALEGCTEDQAGDPVVEDGVVPPPTPGVGDPASACLISDSYSADGDVKITKVFIWNDPLRY